jgi:hypothetical protein
MDKGRYTLWLPVWMHDKVSTCLEITQSRPFSAHKLDVIQGIFHVYQNYQSLLDYSERDALTGLLNRKTFDEQFSRSTADSLARRSARPQRAWRLTKRHRAANPLSSNGWPWWTWTISSKSTTALAICMATRC